MADVEEHLLRTSRTFALAIPLLAEPLRRQVGLAYLALRIADTFEDAATWSRDARIAALGEFDAVLAGLDAARARRLAPGWVEALRGEDADCRALVADTAGIFEEIAALAPGPRQAIVRHVRRTTQGMARVLQGADEGGRLDVRSLEGLREYCYIVAGIVGELLTELFVLEAPLGKVAKTLEKHAAAFGEGLQLVNILKDAGDDQADGRRYLPEGVPRRAVFDLAWTDLAGAATYVDTLQEAGAPRGIVAFTALPVLLARAALEAVSQHGPGAKVPRERVGEIALRMNEALDRGARVMAA